MSKPIISGIQQIGIGISDVHEAWKWYRQHFGMDVPIFDEAAEAALMLPYTGGKPRKRHAVLALNMQGGGGLEIWQYTSRTPQAPDFNVLLGDLGIYVAKFKSRDVAATYRELQARQLNLLGTLSRTPNGQPHFFLTDPYGNICEVVEGLSWFARDQRSTGGIGGSTLGVSDADRSKSFYADILGYDTVVYDETAVFDDLAHLPGGNKQVRRVLLRHSQPRKGSFSELLGATEIELIQVLDRTPNKIFQNRLWGDLGYIHLCWDIKGMAAMRDYCTSRGYPFRIDSGDFDMGEAAGHFAYIEDPDGTLIELVEAFKIPIMKKLGWYLDLRKRNPEKPLPRWMLKALRFGRVRD